MRLAATGLDYLVFALACAVVMTVAGVVCARGLNPVDLLRAGMSEALVILAEARPYSIIVVGLVILTLLAVCWPVAARGVTPGRAALGVRLVNAETGAPPGPKAIARRALLAAPGQALFLVMLLTYLIIPCSATESILRRGTPLVVTLMLTVLVTAHLSIHKDPDDRTWFDRRTGLAIVVPQPCSRPVADGSQRKR